MAFCGWGKRNDKKRRCERIQQIEEKKMDAKEIASVKGSNNRMPVGVEEIDETLVRPHNRTLYATRMSVVLSKREIRRNRTTARETRAAAAAAVAIRSIDTNQRERMTTSSGMVGGGIEPLKSESRRLRSHRTVFFQESSSRLSNIETHFRLSEDLLWKPLKRHRPVSICGTSLQAKYQIERKSEVSYNKYIHK